MSTTARAQYTASSKAQSIAGRRGECLQWLLCVESLTCSSLCYPDCSGRTISTKSKRNNQVYLNKNVFKCNFS